MKRVILAALLGGIAMFVWSALAHTVLPLGSIGVGEIPNEAPVLAALQLALGGNAGLYIFPGMGLGPDASQSEKQAHMPEYAKKVAANPSGLLIYHPSGGETLSNRQLAAEFGTELLESLLAAMLLAMARINGYGARVAFVALTGVLASLPTNISYWNWYGFPANYTAAYMLTQIVGFICMGLVAAKIVQDRRPV
jgi:hypothetical protein